MTTPTQDAGRGERLVTIRSAALAWAARWGVELEVLRRLLPAAARFWAGERPQEGAWGGLSDRALLLMAGQLAVAVRDDATGGDARARILFWAKEGEVELSAAELAPLDDGEGWAEEGAAQLAAHAAELRRRRAAAAPAPTMLASSCLGPDLGTRGRRASPRCGSCGAEIHWITGANGKRHPVDAERVYIAAGPTDTVIVLDNGTTARGHRVGPGPGVRAGYISHFATCPNAKTHRRR